MVAFCGKGCLRTVAQPRLAKLQLAGDKMDRNDGADCPRVFEAQLKTMIAFADTQQDYALGAWLSQALDRLLEAHIIP